MPVPFIDLQRFEDGFLDRWAEICRDITVKTQFVGGQRVAELEARLGQESGLQVVGCANGTDALQLALRAAGVGAGDVVVIPDATFWATFEAVANCGARVVTVDIDQRDLQMDFELFARAVEEYQPKAAILVHLYGWVSGRLDAFRQLCAERDIALIEDGAQVYGVTWNGAPVWQGAQLATLSFYPAKVLGACGDAGAVYCSSEELATTVRRLGNHGRTDHYAYGLVGWNSRMSGFDAAFLNLSLDYMEHRLASRRQAAAWYRRELAARGLTEKLGFEVAAPPPGCEENGYLNVLRFEPAARARIEDGLRQRGIGFGIVYPGTMSSQPAAAAHLEGRVGGERAQRLCGGVLNLPLFAGITEAELEEVALSLAALS